MLSDIISSAIAPQPDMDIVGRGESQNDLVEAAEQAKADVVIVARGRTMQADDCDELLYRNCHLKVLEINAEGGFGSMCEMRPHRVFLGELSPPSILKAIRDSIGFAGSIQ